MPLTPRRRGGVRAAKRGLGHSTASAARADAWVRLAPMFPPAVPRLAGLLVLLVAAAPAAAVPRRYVVDAGASSVRVHVGRAGAFSFAGHTHEVSAPALAGEIVADAALLGASSVSLSFEAGALPP